MFVLRYRKQKPLVFRGCKERSLFSEIIQGWKENNFFILLAFPICGSFVHTGVTSYRGAVWCKDPRSPLLNRFWGLITVALGWKEEPETPKAWTSLGTRRHALKFRDRLDGRQVTVGCCHRGAASVPLRSVREGRDFRPKWEAPESSENSLSLVMF